MRPNRPAGLHRDQAGGPAFLKFAADLSAGARWVDGHRAELAWHRDFERLEIVRGPQFIVFQPARDEHRVALLAAQELAALEFKLDPAVQQVDELAVAGVIMPAGRLRHAGLRLHDLAAHLAAAGLLQGEITVAEEVAPSLGHDRLFGAGIAKLRRIWLGDCRDVIGHRNLLLSWSRSMRSPIVEEAQ